MNQHPCTNDDGSIAYYSFAVRWRHWRSDQIELFGNWSEHLSTNIFPIQRIISEFTRANYGKRPEKRFREMMDLIPAEKVAA